MNKIEKLINKLEEVWPGTLGDDVDIKEIERNLKAINVLMPIVQTMQINEINGAVGGNQEKRFLVQLPGALPVDEKTYEIIKDFILQNIEYQREEAEVVKTVDNSEK